MVLHRVITALHRATTALHKVVLHRVLHPKTIIMVNTGLRRARDTAREATHRCTTTTVHWEA